MFLEAPRIAFSFPADPIEQAQVQDSSDSLGDKASADFARPWTVKEARAWVALNKDYLPAARQELLALPTELRKAVFVALPPSGRAAVWQEKYEQVLSAREWTIEQLDLLSELGPVIKAESFDVIQRSPEHMAELESFFLDWVTRAEELFERRDIYNMIMTLDDLGPAISATIAASPQSVTVRASQTPPSDEDTTESSDASPRSSCTCHLMGWFSCSPTQRCIPGSGCTQTEVGCGPIGLFQCLNFCTLVQIYPN